MSKFPPKAEAELKKLVALMVEGDWEALEACGCCERVRTADMVRVLEESQLKLAVHPDPGCWSASLDANLADDGSTWRVDLALWPQLNGSDLTLQLSILKTPPGSFQIEIDDLRVL